MSLLLLRNYRRNTALYLDYLIIGFSFVTVMLAIPLIIHIISCILLVADYGVYGVLAEVPVALGFIAMTSGL